VRPFALAALLTAACAMHPALDPQGTVAVPGGPFRTGSTLEQRAHAMDRLGRAPAAEAQAGLARLRDESPPRRVELAPFRIMTRPVTHADYHRFVIATGAPEPWIDPVGWAAADTRLPYALVARHAWTNGAPPAARAGQPVVLVDHGQAEAYCEWWGTQHRGRGLLPTELQWEKAARGPAPEATSVCEWTGTHSPDGDVIVKGGSWIADARSPRPAARHARPPGLRHVALGFRCVLLPLE
jgi:formylglycine-generating enzyme required for sulfatase activity